MVIIGAPKKLSAKKTEPQNEETKEKMQELDVRLEELLQWLNPFTKKYGLKKETLRAASADASFRRYFRIESETGATYILMDAPPEREPIASYLKVQALMQNAGLNVPVLFEVSEEKGFILMSDLGVKTYLEILNEKNAATLFEGAIDELIAWQKVSKEGVLPYYDEAVLRRELNLFPEWYVKRHRHYAMTEKEKTNLEKVFSRIVANNLSESKVFVHRDYMPRNLMASSGKLPGVIDFQDALYGPVSYDIASLLRDAFISWPEDFVIDQTIRYWEKARAAAIAVPADFGAFWRDVEWMGLQRHLKVLGIFARINYRDGKPKYLADTPRFIEYVRHTANRYDELKSLNYLLDRFEEGKTVEATTF